MRRIDRPLFLVGCGRSGTTLLYDVVACHPDLAWFSRYTNRWPMLPELSVLNRFHPAALRRGVEHRLVPLPSEGHAVWDRIRPAEVRDITRPLDERDVQRGEHERAAAVIARHQRAQGRPRFVNKNTRNTIRTRYLAAMFPDARFVHVLRDPRPTVLSLLTIDWWPDLPIWCRGGITPTRWVAEGQRADSLAAALWVEEVSRALADAEHLPVGCCIDVRYEELIADPRAVVERVLDHAALDWTPAFERLFSTFEIRDANFKFRSGLDAESIAEVTRITGPLAARLGYRLEE